MATEGEIVGQVLDQHNQPVQGATVTLQAFERASEAEERQSLTHEEGGFGFLPPASTYHRFIKGLTGEKMSSSKPETAIFLDDDPETASKKIMKAITGGRETAEEQREKGGEPDICSVFETMLFHTVDGDQEIERIEYECRNGVRLCGSCKKEAAEHMKEFLLDLKEKRDETEHQINLYVREE